MAWAFVNSQISQSGLFTVRTASPCVDCVELDHMQDCPWGMEGGWLPACLLPFHSQLAAPGQFFGMLGEAV